MGAQTQRGARKRWSAADEELLAQMVGEGALSVEKMADALGRSADAVTGRIRRMRRDGLISPVRRRRRSGGWTPEEDAAMSAMLDAGARHKEIALALGRTVPAMATRISALRKKGMEPGGPNKRAWTPEEDDRFVELLRQGATVGEIARALGRTVSAVGFRAPRLRKRAGIACQLRASRKAVGA